ncbi:MAG: GH25 family lysozyme [Ferruginibacter sp.]
MAAVAYYISDDPHRPTFIHYSEFGIDIPADYRIHGIDVSRHQKNISWKDVKEMKIKNIQIDFAFLKATEGTDLADEKYRANISAARKAGIITGAYHYFIGSSSGKAQAVHFLETADLKKGDLPPVLDTETTNGASLTDLQQRLEDWLLIVGKKYRTKPIIYTNINFYNTFLAGRFDGYPLWIAHYLQKEKPRIERNWTFWQHNETGNVNGIRTRVDFNVFNGDSLAFQKLLLK